MKRGFRGRRKVGELYKHSFIKSEDDDSVAEEYKGWRICTDLSGVQNTITSDDKVDSDFAESCTTCSEDSVE